MMTAPTKADDLMRRILWISVVFNIGGALLFAFPSSPPGVLAGLPSTVPAVYRGMVALFVLLFGAAYGWLALQPGIDRPLVAFAAIGKAGAFGLTLMFWLFDQVPTRSVVMISGDLILAGCFVWWLLQEPATQ